MAEPSPTGDVRFTQATNAETPLELDALMTALEEAGIKAMSIARGDQASDRLSLVGRPYWEVLVAREELERACRVIAEARGRLHEEEALAERAALEEYRGDAPAPDAAAEVATPPTEPAAPDRPPGVTLAGWLHFGLLILLAVFRLRWAAGPAPSIYAAIMWVATSAAIGYALTYGPSRPTFWRRVRIVATLRLAVSVAYGLALAVDLPVTGTLAAADLLVLIALYWGNAAIVRRVLAGALVLDAIAILAWPSPPPSFPIKQPVEAAVPVMPPPRQAPAVQVPIQGEWSPTRGGETLALCSDHRFIQGARKGSWSTEGEGNCGKLILTDSDGHSERARFCVVSGPMLDIEGMLFQSAAPSKCGATPP